MADHVITTAGCVLLELHLECPPGVRVLRLCLHPTVLLADGGSWRGEAEWREPIVRGGMLVMGCCSLESCKQLSTHSREVAPIQQGVCPLKSGLIMHLLGFLIGVWVQESGTLKPYTSLNSWPQRRWKLMKAVALELHAHITTTFIHLRDFSCPAIV